MRAHLSTVNSFVRHFMIMHSLEATRYTSNTWARSVTSGVVWSFTEKQEPSRSFSLRRSRDELKKKLIIFLFFGVSVKKML